MRVTYIILLEQKTLAKKQIAIWLILFVQNKILIQKHSSLLVICLILLCIYIHTLLSTSYVLKSQILPSPIHKLPCMLTSPG